MVRFLCEIFRRTEYPPERGISAAIIIDNEGRKVSKIGTAAHPTTGYWIDWGGSYDTPESNIIALYFNGFLGLAESIAIMIFKGFSMYRETDSVYFVTDFYPWQYPKYQTELSELNGYSSAITDPDNQSDDIIDGIRYPVKFQIPQLQIKLPDAISGSALQFSVFSVSLENSDGFFDISESNNFFNVPIYILKSYLENPLYSDFQIVRRGFIDNITTSFSQLTLSVATIYRSLSDDVCKTITSEQFPNAATNQIGKNIPVAWGEVSVVPILVDTLTYLIIDTDYLVSIDTVYDSDDNVISSSLWDEVNGLLVMDGGAADPKRVEVTGSASSKIGQIITEEMEEKSRILYSDDLWDTAETDDYITISAKLDLLFSTGSVRDLIARVLKSDNAFLIEKSNGKLSLRKWNGNYTTHVLPIWLITQQPEKTHVESKYFASKVRVLYSGGEEVNDSEQNTIQETYRKKQTIDYQTDIAESADAVILAQSLIDRFGQRAEIWTVSFGIETAEISLLDKVIINLIINDRQLSIQNEFLVKSIDVAQDVLVIESIGAFTDSGGIMATPTGPDYNGDMSGFFYPDSDAIMPEKYNREDL